VTGRFLGLALAGSLAGALASCSGVRPPPPRGDARRAVVDPGPSYPSPARWDYHPPAPTTPLVTVQYPDGGCVITAEGGQRWLSAASRQSGNRLVCSGPAVASPVVASEDLSSALRRADGSWLYVGESGALYEATEPLGAFTRTVPAPEPLAKVAGVSGAVLAATMEGKLLRWEAASGWRAMPPSPALAGARVFDLASGGSGRVLALAFPEALFASTDEGLTWTTTSAPPIGARRLGSTSAGELGAQGIFESVVWHGPDFVQGPDRLLLPAGTLAVDVGRAASAAALQAYRAVVEGDRYYEVVRPENDGETWLLARGRIEGRLETTPIADSGRCGNIRIGARGAAVVIACVFSEGSDITAEMRRSDDAGSTWGEPLALTTPDTDQITITVSPDATALVAGVCKGTDASGTCKPAAPVLLREARPADGGRAPTVDAGHADAGDGGLDGGSGGPSLHAFPASAPQLTGPSIHPSFSADGRSAYFLGKRGKDDRTSLFVSHDGGETFSPRVLQPSTLARPPRRAEGDDEPTDSEAPETFEIDESTPPHPGDDGTVGLMVTRSRGGFAYLTTDEDGRVLQMAGPPLDDEGNAVDVILAGNGRRVLAVPAYLGNDGTGGILWESLDGGLDWDKQTMPQSLVREYARGNMALVCFATGCLMGDTVARVGWGSAGEQGGPERPPEPSADPSHAALAPLVCDLSAGTRWSRIDDVFSGEGAPPTLPGVYALMRGRSVWSTLTLDRATGALASVSATLPESGEGEAHMVRRPLLGARGAHTATAISATQVEGYALARVTYTPDAQGKPKVGAPLRDLELVWENLLEGTVSRARVPDAGPLQTGDVLPVAGGIDQLHASMISISARGLFVRVHAAHAAAGDEIFADAKGRVERYASTPWPATGPLGALDFRADAAAVGGELLGLGLLQDPDHEWAAVALARRTASGWAYSAQALLPQRAGTPFVADTTWGSSGKSPVGVTALLADPQHGRAWAHFIGFRGDGTFTAPQPVATLADLGDRPRPCALADRTGTARAAMLLKSSHGTVFFPGARHPVLVFEPRPKNAVGVAEPQVLLTAGAVVHGTPASPCLGAFVAESAVRGVPVSAVIPGDPSRSWLFRLGDAPPPEATAGSHRRGPAPHGNTSASVALEYRPMTCHYDASARIPDIVWTQEGTSRP
jgi:hypothetical protein